MKPKHVVTLVVGCVAAAVIAAIVTWNILANNAKREADQEGMDRAIAADAARSSSVAKPNPSWSDSNLVAGDYFKSDGITFSGSEGTYPAGKWAPEKISWDCSIYTYDPGDSKPYMPISSETMDGPLITKEGETLVSSGCGTWTYQGS